MEADITRRVELGLKRSKILIDRSAKSQKAAAQCVTDEMLRHYHFERRPEANGHKTPEMD